MSEKTIEAILTALSRGFDVELSRGKDGSLKIRTVQKKNLKIE